MVFYLASLLLAKFIQVGADSGSNAFGITGRNFVVLASDTAFRRGTQVVARDGHRVTSISKCALLVPVGDVSSGAQFTEFVQRNLALNGIINGKSISTRSAAYFTRREISKRLRRSPVQADFLLAGVDLDVRASEKANKSDLVSCTPQLYSIDRAGASVELLFGAQGSAAPMVLALLDDKWSPLLSLEEALALARDCISQLDGRYALTPQGWRVNIVDATGSYEAFSVGFD
jgi:20S proteasome subunit beta 4